MNSSIEPTISQLDLDLNDLVELRIFLQLFSKRGCIMPQEMEKFGVIYNKIDKSLKTLAPDSPTLETIIQQQQQQQQQQEQEQEQQQEQEQLKKNNDGKTPKNIITI